MRINTPCKDCNERNIGCHATCERYKEAKREYNQQKLEFSEKKRAYFITYDKRYVFGNKQR